MKHAQHELAEMLPSLEAARRLGVQRQTLAKWRLLGIGPRYVRVSARRILYPADAVAEFLTERTVTPATPGATA